MGSDRPRRYFLAFQNNAELRGTGGFMGNWGVLLADKGRLRLERFGRLDDLNIPGTRSLNMPEFTERWRDFSPAQFWQQVNVSPDFPTTAQVIGALYPQSGGNPVDGVIALDPVGLSALLTLTGPITVPSWNEPITAENVVEVTLKRAYERLAQDARIGFLGEVSHRVADAFTMADLGGPGNVLHAVTGAVRSEHILIHMFEPAEQALMERLGVDGRVAPVAGDSLMIVNQNMAANKLDYYLRRTVRYDVRLDPGGDETELVGRVEVDLHNTAPKTGLPVIVAGPYDDRFIAGENRTYVSVYSPFAAGEASVDGQRAELRSQPDLGRLAHSALISIPSGESRVLGVDLQGQVRLTNTGWFRLDVLHQPSLVPDRVEVSVEVPSGWEITEVKGMRKAGVQRAEATIDADSPEVLMVRIEPTGWSRFWERIRA